MKTYSNRNKQNNKLNKQAIEVIAPLIILVFFVSLIIGIILNIIFTPATNLYDEVIESEFKEVEGNPVGISFDIIRTTESDFSILESECNEFIKNTKIDEDIDAHVEVDTIVDEELYIDSELTKDSINNTDNTDELAETGPIYFDNMLMIRYINELGHLKVISAIFNLDRSTVTVTRQVGLADIYNFNKIEYNESDGDTKQTTAGTKYTEQGYLSLLGNTLVDMLNAKTDDDISNVDKEALKYFTLEGRKTVFGNKSRIKSMSNNEDLHVSYAIAGKSRLSKSYKDRIYVQLSYGEDSLENIICIILKLNSNLRVFDIDII